MIVFLRCGSSVEFTSGVGRQKKIGVTHWVWLTHERLIWGRSNKAGRKGPQKILLHEGSLQEWPHWFV